MLKVLKRTGLEVLQLNLGRVCNLACWHCHHEAGPGRRESMTRGTAEKTALAISKLRPSKIELTGGSPELNPNFRFLVEEARKAGARVAVRTNLVVFFEPGCDFLPEFCRSNEVEIIASLPCYSEDNVDRQRGSGVFRKSIEALKMLNALGYGDPTSGLILNLVYNPGGAVLPGDQGELERGYRVRLGELGVRFNSLFAMANMPIGRFKKALVKADELEDYGDLLRKSANPQNWKGVMCRRTATVGWDGTLYDCDFNLALKLDIVGGPKKIWEIERREFEGRRVKLGDHCCGCIAGLGSGCFGALA